MRKSILAIALAGALISAPAIAADQSIMFEVGIGFGNASGGRTDGNDNAKFCKNRNTGRMVMGAVRYRYDGAEAHVARWFHDEDVRNCDRDMWAVGIGAVIDTQGDGEAGLDDVYASWTPGIAYTFGDEDTDFTSNNGNSHTNWRQTNNFQVFNRVAVGTGGADGMVEVAVHRYGSFNAEHGESFVTIGGGLRDFDGAKENGDRGLTEPTIINNYYEGDTITIEQTINEYPGDEIPTGGQGGGEGGQAGGTL